MASRVEQDYPDYGIKQFLPAFNRARVARMRFPMAYDPDKHGEFESWRNEARDLLFDHLGDAPPECAFDPKTIEEEDRGTHIARKFAFNVSADCRVPGYLLIPKGEGPFPAILGLHDHGGHFSIGKEKLVRPFLVEDAVLEDAVSWTGKCYGGEFVGDRLAARGYVVLVIDALLWGERGCYEDRPHDETGEERPLMKKYKRSGPYETQERLAANLFQLGMSWCGLIVWDDLRSLEYLSSLPEVDAERIGAVGLSVGAHRTWMLAAASDRIKAGAAICWMCTTAALQVEGNNQPGGASSYSMILPGLMNHLDYPDVASIACPKPMLFYAGSEDKLFPVDGVNDAYQRMRRVWDCRDAGDDLVTGIWHAPHEFNREMQVRAFDWMDMQLGRE